MNNTLWQILIWIPALLCVIIGIVYYFKFPAKQRKNHDMEAFGIMSIGIVTSLFIWSMWLIYDIEGKNSMKVTFADHVVWAIVIGIFGTLTMLATLSLIAILRLNDPNKQIKFSKRK